MTRLLRLIWAVYFLLCFSLFFLLFYPFFRLFLSRPQWYRYAHRLRGIWGRILMLLSGLFPSTTYDEPLDRKGTYIFAPNHFSYLDILSVNVQMPFYFNFMAKRELAEIPLFGIFFRTIDIPVDRKRISGAKHAMQLASERLRSGVSILNFPEGGIGDRIPEMMPFKQGAFKLAIEHGVPVVPITLADNWMRMPSGGLSDGGRPGRMRMHVHRPIDTAGLNPGDESMLSEQVYRIIEARFKQMNAL